MEKSQVIAKVCSIHAAYEGKIFKTIDRTIDIDEVRELEREFYEKVLEVLEKAISVCEDDEFVAALEELYYYLQDKIANLIKAKEINEKLKYLFGDLGFPFLKKINPYNSPELTKFFKKNINNDKFFKDKKSLFSNDFDLLNENIKKAKEKFIIR